MRDKSGGFTKAELSEELYDVRQRELTATSLYIEAAKARHAAEVRALKYEQALREIVLIGENAPFKNDDDFSAMCHIARAALDKPGTEGENSANEGEKRLADPPYNSEDWRREQSRKP